MGNMTSRIKRTVTLIASLSLAAALFGCSSQLSKQETEALDKTASISSMHFKYPGSWKSENIDASGLRVTSPNKDASVAVNYCYGAYENERSNQEFIDGITNNPENIRDYSVNGYSGKKFNCKVDVDGATYDAQCVFVVVGNDIAAMYAVYDSSKHANTIDDMLASVQIKESEQKTEQKDASQKEKAREEKKEEPIPSTPSESVSQKNALESAKNYLDIMPFSYDGLIDQLVHDKFSKEDATYAADKCGANWDMQAEKAAASYLDIMPFSRDGLIEQLIHDGFTESQAAHGADSVGL